MNKSIKIVSILMMIIMIVMIATPVFANATSPLDFKDATADNTTGIKNIGGSILGIIRVVGTIIAVGGLLFIGIKYIMGSVEEKAEYKKTLIPYVIGCVLLFAASNLATIIFEWASKISGE